MKVTQPRTRRRFDDEPRADVLTVEEAARSLRVGLSTMYGVLRAGRVPACKIGGQWRILKEDLRGLFVAVGPQALPARNEIGAR